MFFHRNEISKLKQIHKKVFSVFHYTTDQELNKRMEFWQGWEQLQLGLNRTDLRGDCEEFAMTSLQLCRMAGFDARLVICRDETGEGHCITEVATSNGDEAYYMDNRMHSLATRDDLIGYRFYAVGPWNPVPGDTRPWYRVTE